jgi:receptor protein-tyrosine kinase
MEHALRVLKRRYVVILVAVISVPLAALLYSSTQTKEYTASTTVLFESNAESPEEQTREAATNEALAVLPTVAAKAAKKLPGASLGEVLGSVEVSAANEMANVATISATNESPTRAAEIANAYANAYIDFRREARQAPLKSATAVFESRLENLPAGEVSKAEALEQKLNELEIQEALQTGQASVVQQAEPPSSPSQPKTKRNVLIGIVLGIVLAFALAAIIERADKRVRTVEELEELFGLPIIARIPKSKSLQNASAATMLLAPEAEVFRTLRTNIRYLNVNRDLSTILIASPEPNDGKSTVARGLAGAMVEMGEEDVILVEADMRKESAFRHEAAYHGQGLGSVLTGVPLDAALLHVPVALSGQNASRSLTVLPSGSMPPNPSELLESEQMRDMMAELRERYATVVIDSPAFGVVSDAMTLVPLSSAILAVGGIGKTTREAAKNFMSQLAITNQRPLGLIVTMTEKDRTQYGYYKPPSRLLRR